MLDRTLVWLKGAGDLATGVAYRLVQSGFAVVLTELPQPLTVRRTVALAEAVRTGRCRVEHLVAVRVASPDEALTTLGRGELPVLVDPRGTLARALGPAAVIDAVMAKRNTGTSRADAPVTIALGPGFVAGHDVDAVVETARGHRLGRVYYEGAAAADTGVAAPLAGVPGDQRVLRAPADGIFAEQARIGAQVAAGSVVGCVKTPQGAAAAVVTPIAGVLRGLISSGCPVSAGLKVGDVDPTGEVERCYTISDKALAVGGGALEALLHLLPAARPLLSAAATGRRYRQSAPAAPPLRHAAHPHPSR